MCTLFDGLNCFFARTDDPDLCEQLSAPANVFDQFVPDRLWRLMDTAAREEILGSVVPEVRTWFHRHRSS
jgi:hypothetical protein